MGVRGLFSYVKKKIELIDPLKSDPQKIGIDLYGLLYIWQNDLDAIQRFIEAFQAVGHQCIFVFDGEAPTEKKEIVKKRKDQREGASVQLRALDAFLESEEGLALDKKSREHLEKQIKSLRSTSWQITKDYKKKVLEILVKSGATYILAKGEADEELIQLEKKRLITVILSSDMDFVRFGVNRIWIPHFKENSYRCYDFDIPYFCAEEDITIEGLSDVAKLCGSELEYTHILPQEAFGMIRYYGSIENMNRFRNKINVSE